MKKKNVWYLFSAMVLVSLVFSFLAPANLPVSAVALPSPQGKVVTAVDAAGIAYITDFTSTQMKAMWLNVPPGGTDHWCSMVLHDTDHDKIITFELTEVTRINSTDMTIEIHRGFQGNLKILVQGNDDGTGMFSSCYALGAGNAFILNALTRTFPFLIWLPALRR